MEGDGKEHVHACVPARGMGLALPGGGRPFPPAPSEPVMPPFLLLLPALALSSPARADLDVVFVLDTTGSMSGEIHEAKARVRDLAEALRAARPGERIRMGVVAYKDRTDAWVTRVSPLTEEVAVTHRFLEGLDAAGGGDTPEHVAEALRVALQDLDWAQGAERQLFLIADAPAHTDYADAPSLAALAGDAVARGVIVNAIGCRSLSPEGIEQLRGLAYATEGQYHHIGRVEADAGGLADAMLQTLAPEPGDDGPLQALGVHESRRAPAAVEEGPGAGVVVRLGSWFSPLEREPEGAGQSCSLTVMLPPGMDLAGPPELAVGQARLHATLALRPGPGSRSVWELQRCLPTATPVETVLR